MREVLHMHQADICASGVLDELGLTPKQYFIVSVHREENVDSPENLQQVVHCLKSLHQRYGFPVIVSTHPRTKSRLQELGEDLSGKDIRFLKPFGFFAYNKLQQASFCAVSDSGTISEESAMLGFPAVTLRNSIERPEALDAGSIVLTGLNADVLLSAVELAVTEKHAGEPCEIPQDYQVMNTSSRVVKLIMGTAKLTHQWRNMEDFSRYDWKQ